MFELNKEQRLAAESNSSPLLVLAGPGTGKTTALIGRYLNLVNKGTDPKRILCCAFSKKASEEIKTRIKNQKQIF